MSNNIEVVSISDPLAIEDLAREVWTNTEPGFQIEGANTYEDLEFVFASLQNAAPNRRLARLTINNTFLSRIATFPHPDNSYKGLAVHHNISGTFPVDLAVTQSSAYRLDKTATVIDPEQVEEIKHGITTPGRLTVFSGGRVGKLQPTVHNFDRKKSDDPVFFARYTHQGLWGLRLPSTGMILKAKADAQYAVEQIALHKAA